MARVSFITVTFPIPSPWGFQEKVTIGASSSGRLKAFISQIHRSLPLEFSIPIDTVKLYKFLAPLSMHKRQEFFQNFFLLLSGSSDRRQTLILYPTSLKRIHLFKSLDRASSLAIFKK